MDKFGRDAGVTPLVFFEGHPGIFNDHRESGPRFNVSSEGRVSANHLYFYSGIEIFSENLPYRSLYITYCIVCNIQYICNIYIVYTHIQVLVI